MKKLIIAAVAMGMALASQAAAYKWTSSDIYGVKLSDLHGNGSYSATGDLLKGNSTLTFALTYMQGGEEVNGVNGSMPWASGKNYTNKQGTLTGINQSTEYDVVLTITGTQTDMLTYDGDPDWDYSHATISYIGGDTHTTPKSGQDVMQYTPGTWVVSGAVAKEHPEPTPEPTSGLLLLLGVAGLALRRKQK